MGTYGHAWASSCPNSLKFSKKHSEITKKHPNPNNFHPNLIFIKLLHLQGQGKGKAGQHRAKLKHADILRNLFLKNYIISISYARQAALAPEKIQQGGIHFYRLPRGHLIFQHPNIQYSKQIQLNIQSLNNKPAKVKVF